MKCFYHRDPDGKCSAAIVKSMLLNPPDLELISINYGEDFPWASLRRREAVFMVDFSLQPFSDMIELNKHVSLIWIDHHKAALDSYAQAGIQISGYCDMDILEETSKAKIKSGCESTWVYFTGNENYPKPVSLIGRYDVGDCDRNHNIDCIPFICGINAKNEDPAGETWSTLVDPYTSNHQQTWKDILKDGYIIANAKEIQDAETAKSICYEGTFGGYRCLFANTAGVYSRLFDSLWNPTKHDAMIIFHLTKDNKWKIALYSYKEDAEIDLGALAKKYGGGGHRGAAGFTVDTLPSEFLSNKS